MRTSLNNPFSPGSDTIPQVWAGRTVQLGDWRNVLRPRRSVGLPERGRTILGEPGLGKSSLVRRIAQEANDGGDWTTPQLRIPSGADPLKLLAAALLSVADDADLGTSREKRLSDLLARVETVSLRGISASLRGGEEPEPFTVLRDLLVEIGRAAMHQHKVVLIHLDEVQNVSNDMALSQLLVALGDALAVEDDVTVPGGSVVRRSLPLTVYLTGLPEFEERAGAQKGATFSRRFHTTTLGALEDADLRAALQPFILDGWEVMTEDGTPDRVRMDPSAASAIVDLCRGEPFLFQLAGERAWYASTDRVITRDHVLTGWRGAQSEATSHVERILERLPSRENAFLHAMARLDPADRTLSRIARETGHESGSEEGPIARRLDLTRGIINRGSHYSFRHRAIEAMLTTDWPRVD